MVRIGKITDEGVRLLYRQVHIVVRGKLVLAQNGKTALIPTDDGELYGIDGGDPNRALYQLMPNNPKRIDGLQPAGTISMYRRHSDFFPSIYGVLREIPEECRANLAAIEIRDLTPEKNYRDDLNMRYVMRVRLYTRKIEEAV